MLIKITAAIVVIIGLFLVYVAFQPSKMHISREAFINVSPEALFPHVNNSKLSDEWMPWAESDPKMKMAYGGPEAGVNSKAVWTSEGDMGNGEAVIVESIPYTSVKTKLTYTKPMNMVQFATFTLTPKDSGTILRWEVEGENPFISRIFCVFMNMDKMIGGEFEKGLANLKRKVETP